MTKVKLRRPRKDVQYNGLIKNKVFKHGVKDYYTKKYWNENTQRWVCRMPSPLLLSSELLINDFSYFNISKIKLEFRSIWEKVAFFLTQLYDEELSKGYKINHWPSLYWDYKKCKAFLGDGYLSVIHKLENLNLVELERRRNAKEPIKNYLFLKLNENFIHQEHPILKTRMMINSVNEKIILKFFKRVKSEESALEKYINFTSSEVKIDLGINERNLLVDKIVNNKKECDSMYLNNPFASHLELSKLKTKLSDINYYAKYRNLVNSTIDRLEYKMGVKSKVINLDFGARRSSYGNRISHYYSNIPRGLRSKLIIDGEYLVEADIATSQPSFLLKLIDKWFFKSEFGAINDLVYPETFIEAYKGIFAKSQGLDFYQKMASVYNGKVEGTSVTRDQMKELFMMIVFGNIEFDKFRKFKREKLISDVFGKDFYQFLLSVKKLNLPRIDKSKNLSALLQREEAKFLDEVMLDLKSKNIKFLPLYDSLIVKPSDLDTVKLSFQKTIIKNNLGGFLRLK